MSSKKVNTKRRSVCVDCGVRLSAVTATGKIKWQPSQVDDDGLYCEKCYEKYAEPRDKKGSRSK
jgi:uncharacterized protein with PIN domain